MKKHFLKVAIILCIIHHVSLAQKSGYATAIDSTPIYYKENIVVIMAGLITLEQCIGDSSN